MELSQKEQNRSKWRASSRRGRGRGGGQQRPEARGPDLESNLSRYLGSADDDEGDSQALEPALPVRRSQGADLQQLLAESEQFYAQAHFRYRSIIEAVHTEPPPVDVAALEQELVLDPDLLMQALAQLPLTQLLGLSTVPEEFLAEGSWEDAPRVHMCSTAAERPGVRQQDTAEPSAAAQQAPELIQQQQVPQQAHKHKQQLPPWLQHQHQQQQPVQQQTHSMPAASPAPAAPAQPAHPSARASQQEDDTDELLELLLAGKAPPAARQQPATPPAAARVVDDELDALLRLGAGSSAQKPGAQASGVKGSSSTQAGLEDWLDGL